MLYEPTRSDRYLWDTWLVPAKGRYHLFHMQKVAGEPDSLEIGHAVSDDLVRALAVVGTNDECAVRLRELRQAGVDTFIFPLAGRDRAERWRKLRDEILGR